MSSMKTFFDYNIKHLNTFGINSVVATFIEIENKDDISQAIKLCGNPDYILWWWSNIILPSSLSWVLWHMHITWISFTSENNDILVTVWAGENWHDFVTYTITNWRWWIENLIAIPWSCWAAPVQNIGAYGVEIADIFESCNVYNIVSQQYEKLDHNVCGFGYRDSIFKQCPGKYIIVDVTYKLSLLPRPILTYKPVIEYVQDHYAWSHEQSIIAKSIEDIRWSKLPKPQNIGNCWSFFKNPIVSQQKWEELKKQYPKIPLFETNSGYKISAAWLIDQSWLTWYNNTKVGTYEKQPLVLVNILDATKDDVLDCIFTITKKVFDTFWVQLEREVNIW